MKESPDISIRAATADDISLILELIHGLAVYEELDHLVTATEKDIEHSIFRDRRANVLIAEYKNTPAGFALYFYNYSTFLGKANIYLEDLFVLPEFRGKGLGKALFHRLGEIAIENNCSRIDWCCLDWNSTAIKFYNSLGGVHMKDWMCFRLDENGISKLVDSGK